MLPTFDSRVDRRYAAAAMVSVLWWTFYCPVADAAAKGEESISKHFLVVSVPPGLRKNAHQDFYLSIAGSERRYLGSSNASHYVQTHFGLSRPEFAVSADGERLLFRHASFFAGKRSKQPDGIYLVDRHGRADQLELGAEAGGVWVAWPKPLPPRVIPAFPIGVRHGAFGRGARILVNTEGESYPLGLHGATALESLIFLGELSAVEVLLSTGTVAPASNYWETPLLDLAMLHGHEDIALALLEAGAGITATSLAATATYRQELMLDALLKRREEWGAAEGTLEAAMHAIMTRRLELAYARVWGAADRTFALLDLTAADRRIVVKLLEAGAAVDAVDAEGKTALQLAVVRVADFDVDWGVLDELLRHGADINVRDKDGNTALHFASSGIANEQDAAYFEQSRRAQLLRYLLANGADLTLRNASGGTALQVATQSNRLRTAELLIAHGADGDELFIYAGMGRNIKGQTIRQRIDAVKKELWR